ncbi:hypothetical protein HMPREF9374_1845 [Desmospora sp. 8437]|nr:hypothetical protein HMPREF9374_1845 [Desmospora sp. 8437]
MLDIKGLHFQPSVPFPFLPARKLSLIKSAAGCTSLPKPPSSGNMTSSSGPTSFGFHPCQPKGYAIPKKAPF